MVSIIMTAYNNTLYIKGSLNSIIESCGGIEYEILIGIDNCRKTLNYLDSIKETLPPNIKILFFNKKPGTYVIRNTLALESKYDNLIFFDSDDIMKDNTVTDVLKNLNSHDSVRLMLMMFKGKVPNVFILTHQYSFGAFAIKKNVFLDLNGFEPWTCAADGDFIWRLEENGYKIKKLQTLSFFYRRHHNSLTNNPETNMISNIRKTYHNIRKVKKINEDFIKLSKLTTSDFKSIDDVDDVDNIDGIDDKFILSIIIPTFNNVEFIKECLSSVIKSVKSLNCEILVGIDDCKKTLNFVEKEIFDSRIRFFYFSQNVGPYIVKNTLVKNSNSKTILFFDSDDVMCENMVEEILRMQSFNDFVRPKYFNFNGKTPNSDVVSKEKLFGEGVFSIKKSLFLSMNGFEGWRTTADTDFIGRLYKNSRKSINTPTVLFYRRLHQNSLTQSKQTGHGSKIRSNYNNLIRNKKTFGPLPYLCVSPFYEVSVGYIKPIKPIEVFDEVKHKKMVVNEVVKKILSNTNLSKTNIDYDLINKVTQKQGVYVPVNHIKPIRENKPVDRTKITEIKKDSLSYQARNFGDVKKSKKSSSPNIFSGNNKRKGGQSL